MTDQDKRAQSAQVVRINRDEADIVRMTIDRPQARNALSFDVWQQFAEALDEIERATPPRALILSGNGKLFCAGGDIKVPPARGEGALRAVTRLEWGQRAIRRMRELPTITIAVVEGAAIGLGWSLALACDLIVAEEGARFSAPFIARGLVPDGGAAWFLSRRLGRYRSSEILLTGRVVTGREAWNLGLVSHLVEDGAAATTAEALAADLPAEQRRAIELTKRLLHQAEVADLETAHAIELAFGHICQVERQDGSA